MGNGKKRTGDASQKCNVECGSASAKNMTTGGKQQQARHQQQQQQQQQRQQQQQQQQRKSVTRGILDALTFMTRFFCAVLLCPVGLTLNSLALTICFLFYCGPVIQSIMVIYIIFCIFDSHGDRCGYDFLHRLGFTKFWRNMLLWKNGAKYFPVELVKTVELDEGPYLFASFPHGVFSLAAHFALISNGAGVDETFPKVRIAPLIISLLFKVPFMREVGLFAGLGKATAETADHAFSKGLSVLLMPGGAAEALLQPCPEKKTVPIFVKERRGFVRLALRHKVPLVPVYSFGEHDVYTVHRPTGLGQWAQLQMKNIFTFSLPLFWGDLWFIPHRKRQKVVIGTPIRTDDYDGELTEEIVRAKHEEFKKALVELFEEHREDFYPKDYKLEFVHTTTIGFAEAWRETFSGIRGG